MNTRLRHAGLALGLCLATFTLFSSCPSAYFVASGCQPSIKLLRCALDDGSSTITSYFRVTNVGTKEIPRIDVNIVAHLGLKNGGEVSDFKYSGSATNIPPGRSVEGIAMDNLSDPYAWEVDTTKTYQEVSSWVISQ